ncbi:hypothetical protein [Pelobacter propionicus]|uniref:Uncharacterized protein n=1 Tax=Pelobacter propionicus (strain DSM 2379 / NBRC 103807 / OttBd1) TaxID=338966 RepID=A1AN96_PELPD|nr:hypothetical protein [Pelobacter propionicus]ABK98816.1 hypothetical protein Ppro_1195 [Pelobacter propionicus DSM 2379]
MNGPQVERQGDVFHHVDVLGQRHAVTLADVLEAVSGQVACLNEVSAALLFLQDSLQARACLGGRHYDLDEFQERGLAAICGGLFDSIETHIEMSADALPVIHRYRARQDE